MPYTEVHLALKILSDLPMFKSNLSILRLLAWLEGFSFLLLLGLGMPLKYYYQMPQPNMVIGMIHGLLFIAYCVYVMIVRPEQQWNRTTTVLALLASLLPFGTFVADARYFKEAINRKQ